MNAVRVRLSVSLLFRRRILALLLVGALIALACPQPAEAQLKRVVGGVGRSISDSWKRIVSEPQRFRIRPQLIIDPQRQASAITVLSADISRRLILAVHGDGAAHLWDIDRGVRVGGRFADIVTGVARDTGLSPEIVVVHRDGSVSALRLDGGHRAIGAAIPGFDGSTTPTLSADGSVMAFRAKDGGWHVSAMGLRHATLRDAARDAQPILSPDGSTIVYRAANGNLIAGRVTTHSGVQILGSLDGCGRGVPVTAGVFTPIGTRIVLGDARGRLCAWAFAGTDAPKRLFTVPTKDLDGAVQVLAMNRDGSRVAARASNGEVEIWTVSGKIRRLSSARLSRGSSHPILLDTSRQWLLAGEADGTIAIHSIERRESPAIGWLISTSQGWTVLDREGRFDGSQSGIDALTWSGETATRIRQDLPVDAFSERVRVSHGSCSCSSPDFVQAASASG